MYCQHCGTEFNRGDRFCGSCGNERLERNQEIGQIEEELHLVLPMGTPISAIIAGYLGLVSVLILPAPFAVVMGFVGLRQIKKGGKRYGKARCWVGIILGGIVTIGVVAIMIESILNQS